MEEQQALFHLHQQQEPLFDMFDFLMPQYVSEGKSNIVIAIGCTGGKHRSVTLANELTKHLTDCGYNTFVNHRDINKDRIVTIR